MITRSLVGLFVAVNSLFAIEGLYGQNVSVVTNAGLRECRISLATELVIGVEDAPAEQAFGAISSVGVAPNGDIYVLDGMLPGVRVFSASGTYLRTVGRKGRGPGEFDAPYRIDVSARGLIVFDRTLGRLVEFDLSGNHMRTSLLPFETFAPPFLARGVDGSVYVAGADANAVGKRTGVIHQLDTSRKRIRSFGDVNVPDTAEWKHLGTGALEVMPSGNVLFAPITSADVIEYTSDGKLKRRITRQNALQFLPRPYINNRPGARPGELMVSYDNNRALSINLDLDAKQNIWRYIRDVPGNQMLIDVFTPDGKILRTFSFPLKDAVPYQLDRLGRLYAIRRSHGYPQLVRYRPIPQNALKGGASCSN